MSPDNQAIEKRLVHKRSGSGIVEFLRIANTPWARIKGLLFTKELKKGHGLWIIPCNAVHMMGMRYAIDLLFLDRQNHAVRTISSLRPNHISPIVWKARSVVELPEGTLTRHMICVGDEVEIA